MQQCGENRKSLKNNPLGIEVDQINIKQLHYSRKLGLKVDDKLSQNAQIRPNFNYCNDVWDTCMGTDLHKKLQNRAAKP